MNITNIMGSANIEFANYVREYEKLNSKKIIKLQTGDPDFATHPYIIEATYKSLKSNETHYTSSKGDPELLERIKDKLLNQNNIKCEIDNIIVCNGATQGIFLAINSIVSKGDEAIIIEPYWMPYISILNSIKARIQKIRIDFENFNENSVLNEIQKKLNQKTKLIIINSPSNPSGVVFGKFFYFKLLELLHPDVYLITDEVYEDILYNGQEHVSPLSLNIKSNQIISVFSLSKSHAMTGFRVGYVVAEKNIIEHINKLIQLSVTCLPQFIQKAAVVAISNSECLEYSIQMRNEYEDRRNLLSDFKYATIPNGAFYSLIKPPPQLQNDHLTRKLVSEIGVAASPGQAFGLGNEYIRITLAINRNELKDGISKLVEYWQRYY